MRIKKIKNRIELPISEKFCDLCIQNFRGTLYILVNGVTVGTISVSSPFNLIIEEPEYIEIEE